ncbi:MAG: prepilin-type N-terminal cleavage/methylation domain-containing protein [Patescibacteria group bacterium]|jgi:prepilin-type N-terminal cleavage/methylation domain-containing protein
MRAKEEHVKSSKGFTLIELMIIVVIIGILAAIAIPNFLSMQDREREGSVKANMHTVQLAVEDFSTENNGLYATSATDALPSGEIVQDMCPGNVWPENPFGGDVTEVYWTNNFSDIVPYVPARDDTTTCRWGGLEVEPQRGDIYIMSDSAGYAIYGLGASGQPLSLMLRNGY